MAKLPRHRHDLLRLPFTDRLPKDACSSQITAAGPPGRPANAPASNAQPGRKRPKPPNAPLDRASMAPSLPYTALECTGWCPDMGENPRCRSSAPAPPDTGRQGEHPAMPPPLNPPARHIRVDRNGQGKPSPPASRPGSASAGESRAPRQAEAGIPRHPHHSPGAVHASRWNIWATLAPLLPMPVPRRCGRSPEARPA